MYMPVVITFSLDHNKWRVAVGTLAGYGESLTDAFADLQRIIRRKQEQTFSRQAEAGF